MLLPILLIVVPSDVVRLEAEKVTLDGPTVAAARAGYSGTGYATGLTKEGIYGIRLRYAASPERGSTIAAHGAGLYRVSPVIR